MNMHLMALYTAGTEL